MVLPKPGASSINKCPRANNATVAKNIDSCLPTITLEILSTTALSGLSSRHGLSEYLLAKRWSEKLLTILYLRLVEFECFC